MRSIKTFFIQGLFVGLSLTSFGQTPDSLKLIELENVIQNDMKVSGAPGAVIAVVKDGKMIYQKSFGLSNVNTQIPVNNTTIFQMASITKTFTAATLLTICERNNIDIHAPIGSILKDFPPKLSQITIHQLLSHGAGIMGSWPNNSECKESLLEYFLSVGDRAVFEEPGKVFTYSNSGYTLAGLLIATLNKSSYTKAVHDILIEPLGMKSTTFELREVATNFFATGHMNGKTVPVSSTITSPIIQPAGGLFSNVEDMAKFASCIMNNGSFDSKQIISKEVIHKMFGKYQPFMISYPYLSYPESYYGYGLANYTYEGINFSGHSGEAGSQNSLLVMAPDYKTAIIVCSNAGYYPFISSIEKAVGVFLPKQKNSKEFKRDSKQILGKYYAFDLDKNKNEWIEVALKDKKQTQILFPESKKSFILNQYADKRYKFEDPSFKFPSEIGFYTDESGKIEYLIYLGQAYIKE